MAEVLVYAAHCAECGRVGDAGRTWDSATAAPAALPACRCGAVPSLEPVDVNELALRASMAGFVASSCATRPRPLVRR